MIEYQQTRDFSKKMGATFDFIKQNFKPFSKCLLFIAGPPVIISSIFISDVFDRFMGYTMAATQNRLGTDGMGGMQQYLLSSSFWLQVVGILVFAWIGGVITIATVYGYMRLYNEKKSSQIEVSEVWERVRKTFWMHFATLTLYFFMTIVIYLILAIPLFIIIGLASVVSPFIAIIGVLGFYLMAGVVGMNMSMIFIIRENEPIGFFDGLQRLIFLVKGKMWSTFGIGIINVLIQSTVSTLFFIPWYISFIISMLHSVNGGAFEEPSSIMQTVNSLFLILYFVCNTLLYALPLIGLAFQYYNLVELKEARGLMSNIETFGETPVQAPTDEHY